MTKIINTYYTETKKNILTIFERFLALKHLSEATNSHFFCLKELKSVILLSHLRVQLIFVLNGHSVESTQFGICTYAIYNIVFPLTLLPGCIRFNISSGITLDLPNFHDST